MLNVKDRSFFLDLVDEIQKEFEHHRDIALKCVMKAWKECSNADDPSEHLSHDTIRAKARDDAKFVSECLWLLAGISGNDNLFDGPKYNGADYLNE